MNPSRLLRNMCLRHGVPPGDVRSLIPVIQKALDAPAWVRDRILTIVEGNLAERSAGEADEEALAQDLDRELLYAVAAMLHALVVGQLLHMPRRALLELGLSALLADLPHLGGADGERRFPLLEEALEDDPELAWRRLPRASVKGYSRLQAWALRPRS